jgi:hypothetical protein
MRHPLSVVWIALTSFLLVAAESGSDSALPDGSADAARGGFSLSGATVPVEEIIDGGPGRDGIRSVDAPEFVPVPEASWVVDETPVLGVEIDGDAAVYPIHLLEYHQIVNDTLAGVPVVVTFDPLTGTPRAYRRRVDGKVLDFGVSGLLYNAGFLMYDRETESLWSQFEGRALAGPLAGQVLTRIPIHQEPVAAWILRHPGSRVLARPELKKLDYRHSPYKAYWLEDRIPFPVKDRDERFHAKEVVLGLESKGVARAYLGSIVNAAGGRVRDEFAGHEIEILYDTDLGLFAWELPPGIDATESYWFAWKAFHPDTEIWRPKPVDAGSVDSE